MLSIAILLALVVFILLVFQFKVHLLASLLMGLTAGAGGYLLTREPLPGSSLIIIFLCIVLLVLFISHLKINAFLGFLIISIIAGLCLGIDVQKITTSVQKGIGDMLGSLVIVIVSGAMLGKLVADSGAAQQIASFMVKLFGQRYIHWALMITGFIIGIPLFYNVGFVLVVPLIFSVAYRYKLSAVYIGLPMLASLSVTHGFLPPHPSPAALVGQFKADMATTLFYGVLVGFPTVVIAGPLFARTIRNMTSPESKIFDVQDIPEDKLPGLGISIFSSLLPVILLAITTLVARYTVHNDFLRPLTVFISDSAIVMLLSLAIATITLGLTQGMGMKKIMDIYGEAVKDISMVLLIMGGAGALKQVLIESGVSDQIGEMLQGVNVNPLVLGWSIACLIRVCVGSATVAGLTAAGIMAPLLVKMNVDPNLMVLSIGAGSLMFSHVNDTGFWLFKEYFNLSLRQTMRSWSLMESIVSVCGLIGVMAIHYYLTFTAAF